MDIRTVCVLGAGAMGHGIAQVLAQGGLNVFLYDIKEDFVEQGLSRITSFLDGSVKRGKTTSEEAQAILGRISTTTSLDKAAAAADLVIEAIIEDMGIKQEHYRKLDKICPQHAIFASNTSYKSVTEMATVTDRQERFLGMHWFNPPQIMKGIEITRTERTSDEVLSVIVELCRTLGKEPVVCIDSPGFIANRILQIWRNEALRIYDEGIASFQDIDTALKVGSKFKMGPFEFLDLVGMDVAIIGNETLYQEFRRDIFKPPRSLTMKVRAGEYGRKTGRGFYDYQS